MSQYSVSYLDEADVGFLTASAKIAYHHPEYPYPREQFTEDAYTQTLVDDLLGFPVLGAYLDGQLVAGIAFTDLTTDQHMPGKGSIVSCSVAHPDHPRAAGLLLRVFVQALRAKGASWYQISKRLDACTILTKYRRLYGKES